MSDHAVPVEAPVAPWAETEMLVERRRPPLDVLSSRPSRRPGLQSWALLGAIIAAATTWLLPLVTRPITYRGDAWRQADTASFARNYSRGSFEPFHPQINWGGNGPGYVESEFPISSIITSGFYRVFGENVAFGRGVSLAFAVAALIGFALLARRIVGERLAWVALVAFAVAPVFTRYATAFMPEASVLAFVVWALYLFSRWLDERTWSLAGLTTLMTALALLAKPTAAYLGIVFAAMLLQRDGSRAVRDPQAWTIAVGSIVPPVAWMIHARSLWQDYGNTFGVLSGGDAKLGDVEMYTSLSTYIPTGISQRSVGLTGMIAITVLAVFGVPLVLAGLRRVRRNVLVASGLIGVGLMYLFTIRYSSQSMGSQYHVHALPFVALAVAWGAARLWGGGRLARGIVAVSVLGASLVAAAAYADQFRAPERHELACVPVLAEVVQPGELVAVVSDSQTTTDRGRFANNHENPIVLFHADVYGWSIATDLFVPEELARLRAEGAAWLVVPDPRKVEVRPEIQAATAASMNFGTGTGCTVHRMSNLQLPTS